MKERDLRLGTGYEQGWPGLYVYDAADGGVLASEDVEPSHAWAKEALQGARLVKGLGVGLPAHKAGLSLTHNDHLNVYESAAEHIANMEATDCPPDWVGPEQRQRALDTGSIWILRWYPDTPIGFVELWAADLDVLLAAARS